MENWQPKLVLPLMPGLDFSLENLCSPDFSLYSLSFFQIGLAMLAESVYSRPSPRLELKELTTALRD